MPEIVENNISGIIVPPKDSSSLAQVCIKIISNIELANKMGLEGKRIVKERFTIGKMIDSYEEVFSEVLKKN